MELQATYLYIVHACYHCYAMRGGYGDNTVACSQSTTEVAIKRSCLLRRQHPASLFPSFGQRPTSLTFSAIKFLLLVALKDLPTNGVAAFCQGGEQLIWVLRSGGAR